MEDNEIEKILNYLQEQRGYDFTGNRLSMLERRITKRLFPIQFKSFEEYFAYPLIHPEELNELLDVLSYFNTDFQEKDFINCIVLTETRVRPASFHYAVINKIRQLQERVDLSQNSRIQACTCDVYHSQLGYDLTS